MSAEEFLQRAEKLKIAVIGDFINDQYIIGSVDRISPEAPVVVLNEESLEYSPGGAGNVCENLDRLGIGNILFTIGDNDIIPFGSQQSSFIHPGKTQTKIRVMAGNQHLLRIDKGEINEHVPYDRLNWKDDLESLIPSLDCLIFSDYHKGTINHDLIAIVIQRCNDLNIPVVVDAKKLFSFYHDATVVKCNFKEWTQYHDETRTRIDEMVSYHRIKNMVVTYGEMGMSYWTDPIGSGGVEGIKVSIVDSCGAGDTVTALLAVCIAQGLDIHFACMIANKAAAETCRHPGVYPITKEDLIRIW